MTSLPVHVHVCMCLVIDFICLITKSMPFVHCKNSLNKKKIFPFMLSKFNYCHSLLFIVIINFYQIVVVSHLLFRWQSRRKSLTKWKARIPGDASFRNKVNPTKIIYSCRVQAATILAAHWASTLGQQQFVWCAMVGTRPFIGPNDIVLKHSYWHKQLSLRPCSL